MIFYNTGKLTAVNGDNPEAFGAMDIALTALKLLSIVYVFFALSRLILSQHLVSSWYTPNWSLLSVGLASIIAALPVSAAVFLQAYIKRYDKKLVKLAGLIIGGICLSVLAGITHIAIAGMSVGLSPVMMMGKPLTMGLLASVPGVLVIASAIVHWKIVQIVMTNKVNAQVLLFWDAVNSAFTTIAITLLSAWIWQLL